MSSDPLCAYCCAPVSALEVGPAPVAAPHRPSPWLRPAPPLSLAPRPRHGLLPRPPHRTSAFCGALLPMPPSRSFASPNGPSCPCHRATLEPWSSEPPAYRAGCHEGRGGGSEELAATLSLTSPRTAELCSSLRRDPTGFELGVRVRRAASRRSGGAETGWRPRRVSLAEGLCATPGCILVSPCVCIYIIILQNYVTI
jgi:hypothetical protein